MTRRKALTYGQLPASPGYRVAIHCPECGDRFSACRGDYFMIADDRPVKCGECKVPMQLTREVRSFEVLAG